MTHCGTAVLATTATNPMDLFSRYSRDNWTGQHAAEILPPTTHYPCATKMTAYETQSGNTLGKKTP